MRSKMEESPVVQEGPPNALPLQCVLKENDLSNIQWQDFEEKITGEPNSRLLFLTVEFIQDGNKSETEFNNYSPNISENERLSPFDTNLNSSGRYSPLCNTLVIPADRQSQFHNSLVVLPSSRNDSQQISILLEQSQVRRSQFVVEEKTNQSLENLKLRHEPSNLQNNEHANCTMPLVGQENCDQNAAEHGQTQRLIITALSEVVLSQDTIVNSMGKKTNFLSNENIFIQGEPQKVVEPTNFVSTSNESIRNEFPSPPSHETVLVNEAQDEQIKSFIDSSKYVISVDNLKQDELLLPDPDQNHDLLMKSEALMEVDSYSLTHGSYITPEDGNSYQIIEEQLNLNNIEKADNEYLLPEAVVFEGTDSSVLQSNLEVFTSQVIGNNGLLPYDKTRPRPSKKQSADQLGFDYWCEDCEFGMKCSRHEVKIISDKPVVSRARGTLPKELLTINKVHATTNEEDSGAQLQCELPRSSGNPGRKLLGLKLRKCSSYSIKNVEIFRN